MGAGDCAGITRSTPFAVSAKVGDTGATADGTIYSGCLTSGEVQGFIKGTWSLERERGVTLFCLNTRISDASRIQTFTGAFCSEIDTAGEIGDRARQTIFLSGYGAITARNY